MDWSIVFSVASLLIACCAAYYTRKQYLSGVRPELFSSGCHWDETKMHFYVGTRNKPATISKIEPLTKNITICNRCPIVLTQDEEESIVALYKKDRDELENDTIRFRIHYKDKENNRYKCTYTYQNRQFSLSN